MNYNNKQKTLFNKFDKDMKERSWIMRFLLVLDQMGNVVFLNGSQDETISSHIARKQDKGESNWFLDGICCLLSKIERNHCQKSKGE